MNKREISEIKRRLKKEGTTIDKMAVCYMTPEDIKFTDVKTFLNLEDEEFYKYLEIVKKVLSGTPDDNLLSMSFSDTTKQDDLMHIVKSGLKQKDMLLPLFQNIREYYGEAENIVVALFHDVYDVPERATDNLKTGESDEVYEYIVCAICPVTLSKPGLVCTDDNITVKERVWEIGAPTCGFLYPAFNDRQSDAEEILFYTKDAKEPRTSLIENSLGLMTTKTITQKREILQNIVSETVGEENADETILLAKNAIFNAQKHSALDEQDQIREKVIVEAFEEKADTEEAKIIADRIKEELPEFTYSIAVTEKEIEKNKDRIENIELKAQIEEKRQGINITAPEDNVDIREDKIEIRITDEAVTVNGKKIK